MKTPMKNSAASAMRIQLINAGKRFNRDWIFRKVNLRFDAGGRYAIIGPNGSGKSTLLQLIAGYIQPSEGSVNVEEGLESFNHNFSLAAPYLELMEEMTAMEQVRFHQAFRKLTVSPEILLEAAGLANASEKPIRYFSSGMKQRLKLALAFHSESPALILDEPTTNLDEQGIELYRSWISNLMPERILMIGSNDKTEYFCCDNRIDLKDLRN
jgi:ABC-type multidrug transport system ATPase subunit